MLPLSSHCISTFFKQQTEDLVARCSAPRNMATLLGIAFVMQQVGSSLGSCSPSAYLRL
jgi:hypothetical protein